MQVSDSFLVEKLKKLVYKMSLVEDSLLIKGWNGEISVYAEAVRDTALFLLGEISFIDKYTCLNCFSNSFYNKVTYEKCFECGSKNIRWEYVRSEKNK